MTSLTWCLLARITLRFTSAARRAHFCEDIIPEIERRLYRESPFPIHHA
nr:MAG TPA: hypothetical protein [Caudoviricetes sp.]